MNTKLVLQLLEKKGAKPSTLSDDDFIVGLPESVHPDVRTYLSLCLPDQVIGASDVRVLPLSAIKDEHTEGATPGSFIGVYGYLVIATSIGGNAICIQITNGKVFWADHTNFSPDTISFKDQKTNKWVYLHDYNFENVERALILLSENIETFLINLLSDRLTTQLEALD